MELDGKVTECKEFGDMNRGPIEHVGYGMFAAVGSTLAPVFLR